MSKIITLVECTIQNWQKMITLAKQSNREIFFFDTHDYDEDKEYKDILKKSEFFLNSAYDVLLARFSGREKIARIMGDDISDMVFIMSCNKYSGYYTEFPVYTFLELLNLFEKETLDKEKNIYAYVN